MKLLSIDIGIKNLSFCLFEHDNASQNSDIKILKWDNIDLSEKNESKCIELDKNGLCDKPAKFVKDGKCYCLKHSKKHTLLQPKADLKPSYLNKQKIQGLIEIADKYKVKYENPPKKAQILALLNNFATNNCFQPIIKTNASKIDLVTIGRNIQHKFDEILCEHLLDISTIIIENQIGPLANKMKTIQGMISQYFIMKNNHIQIEFISASNKLKDYMPKDKTDGKKEKLDYKQRKHLGIQTCLEMVSTDHRFKQWETFFHKHTKKDDLSDCFLQGMWFIKYKTS
jgi:hypothetical protein